MKKEIQCLWDYMNNPSDLQKSDVIIGLGSYDLAVAKKCADLYLKGYAPLILFTGGFGKNTSNLWQKEEAIRFQEVALKMGVPKEKILIEKNATNTQENALFAQQILKVNGIDFQTSIVVTKPYMIRRARATFEKNIPTKTFLVTSETVSCDDYLSRPQLISKDEIIEVLVGDIQRIKVYAKKGYQTKQEIPKEVWHAYENMIAKGYKKYKLE